MVSDYCVGNIFHTTENGLNLSGPINQDLSPVGKFELIIHGPLNFMKIWFSPVYIKKTFTFIKFISL